MKKLLTALALGVSLTAQADVTLPTKAIDTFAITMSSKLVLASNQGSYIAPFSNCSIQSIAQMKDPNIFFARNRVRPNTAVTIYDRTDRSHAVRCTIEKVEHYEQNYLALR